MAVWIIIAVVLVAVELHSVAFFAIFGAAGAVAGAIVAAFSPSAFYLQVAVAVLVAAAGVILVRPYASRRFTRQDGGVVAHGVHGGLLGARVMTLDEVTTNYPGHVRLLGETWLAVTNDDSAIAPGTLVEVIAVTGTTLTVQTVATKENP